MQGNRAKGMTGVLVKFWVPPKVKKQSKQKRKSGLGKEDKKLEAKDKVWIEEDSKKKYK